MVPRLTPVDWQDLARFFEAHGFVRSRTKGSHLSMVRPKTLRPVIIPMHGDVTVDVIHSNLRTAGLRRDDLLNWLQGSIQK
jgi:predicted RNA binding protein YcfA (HicA-like mRNA interferase family)